MEKTDRQLTDLEINALMVLRDSRPDCFLRRSLNHTNQRIYKLMDSNNNPVTYILCRVVDKLAGEGFLSLHKHQGSDYLFKLSMDA